MKAELKINFDNQEDKNNFIEWMEGDGSKMFNTRLATLLGAIEQHENLYFATHFKKDQVDFTAK